MQLVFHAPFGMRINKGWGLALRKSSAGTLTSNCRQRPPRRLYSRSDRITAFRSNVFRYLLTSYNRGPLDQAVFNSPLFEARWRWTTTWRSPYRATVTAEGPAAVQRLQADDLMAAVFPALPPVSRTSRATRFPTIHWSIRPSRLPGRGNGHRRVEGRARAASNPATCGWLHAIRPSRRSSPTSCSTPGRTLSWTTRRSRSAARRRCMTRRAGEPSSAGDLGALDPAAIERVRDEVRPEPIDAHEMHDVLISAGFVLEEDLSPVESEHLQTLQFSCEPHRRSRRAALGIWVAAERVPELRAVVPGVEVQVEPPPSRAARTWTRDDALVELLRGRLMFSGPITAHALAAPLGLAGSDADAALLTLEGQGLILRGHFSFSRTAGPFFFSAQLPASNGATGRSGAHPPLYAESASGGDRAGRRRGLHALPLRLAAPRTVRGSPASTGCEVLGGSTASSWQPGHGSAPFCRRASTATTRPCSTCSA